jgi:hypothetical protein
MKRFSRLVFWVLVIELVLTAAYVTRVRREAEKPLRYLGAAGAGPAAERESTSHGSLGVTRRLLS